VTVFLVVTGGPGTGMRVQLDGELVVGREAEGLTIDDPELSRRHAVLRTTDGIVEIEDLGSRNGTLVNGRRIDTPTRVGNGDAITVGRTALAVDLPRSAATAASEVPAGPIVPSEPFGTYLAPAAPTRTHLGVASRQLLPILLSWTAVAGTAVALTLYFALR
jgi:predicted component of type VI protein secretion system